MEKYILAKDSDFRGYRDGEFQYIGEYDYVIIPEYIKGVKVTKTSDSGFDRILEKRPDIKGVIFQGGRNITDMTALFRGVKTDVLELKYLDTSNVNNMTSMFASAEIKNIDLLALDTRLVKSFRAMFAGIKTDSLNLERFDTSKAESFAYMFARSQVENLDLRNFDTSSATSMYAMFEESNAVEILGLNNFDTSKVENMEKMFNKAKNTDYDVSSFNTSNVINMASMFSGIRADVLDLSGFDTSKVENMGGMFSMSSINKLDISNFNTGSVTKMSTMFFAFKYGNLDLGHFNTSNVREMGGMFNKAVLDYLDLTTFDLTNVTYIDSIFTDAQIKLLDISNFDIKHIPRKNHLFNRAQIDNCIVGSKEDQDLFLSLTNIPNPILWDPSDNASIKFTIKKELSEQDVKLMLEAIIETRVYVLKILAKAGLYDKKTKFIHLDQNFETSFSFGVGGYANYSKQQSNSFNLADDELDYCAQLTKEFMYNQDKFMFVDNTNEFIELNNELRVCIVSPGDVISGDELKFLQTKTNINDFVMLVNSFVQLNNIFKVSNERPYDYNLHKTLTRSFIRIKEILKEI